MESVNKWFAANCPYTEGVAIYSGLSRHNPNLLKNFKLKESASNVEKLKYELGKLRNVAEPTATPPKVKIVINIDDRPAPDVFTTIEVAASATQKKQALLFSQLPPELRPELLRANEVWKKNCYLKVMMNDLPAEAEKECLKIQIEIDDNIKENEMCWKKIDFWLEHRQLPKTIETDYSGLTPLQLFRKQQLLFQNYGKMEKRLAANIKLLATIDDLEKPQLERKIAKQKSDLIKKAEEKIFITRIIDGK